MSPNAHNLTQGFVNEGRFLAFPLAVADDSLPIPADESHLRAVGVNADGRRVYGTTGGAACHVFVASHKGTAGGVHDLGVIEGATELPFVAVTETEGQRDTVVVGATLGDCATVDRCRAVFPQDTIQEPTFGYPDFERIWAEPAVTLLDAVSLGPADLWCLTDRGLVHLDLENGGADWLQKWKDPPHPQLVAVGASRLCWIDADGLVHRFNADTQTAREIDLGFGPLAEGSALCAYGEMLVIADSAGRLCEAAPESGAVYEVGQAPLPHVQCLSALPDGRAYGVCGAGIGHFFRAELATHRVVDLGAIASVIVAQRYGFEFSTAVTGPEGEVYLAEADRGGHLWVYLPPATPAAA